MFRWLLCSALFAAFGVSTAAGPLQEPNAFQTAAGVPTTPEPRLPQEPTAPSSAASPSRAGARPTPAAEPGPGQVAEPAAFRAAARLIVRAVDVRGRDGRPIEGLTAADFAVEENGELQEVAFVEFQQLTGRPGTGATARAAAPPPAGGAGRAPELREPRYRDRRLVALFFDLTAMPEADQLRAWEGALAFIDCCMEPADLLAVMMFDRGAVSMQQTFTDDRERLRAALRRLMVEGGGLDGADAGDSGPPGAAFGQNDAEFNVFNTDRQLSALETAAKMLAGQDRRTTLIWFGSGLRLNGRDNRAQYRATVNAAVRANVTINPVDARGLSAAPPLGDASVPSPGGVGVFSGTSAAARLRTFQTHRDTLHALAGDTGGRAAFDDNDLASSMARVTRGAESYYLLAWYSTHVEPDGRVRRVRITLNGDRSAELAYQPAYLGDKVFAAFSEADRERHLEEALASDYPLTELTLALEVNHFQLNRAEYYVPVFVTIPGGELEAARRRGGRRVVVDFIGEVRTAYGVTIQNVRDRLDIRLTDDAARRLEVRPVHYETGFSLLPDDYVIKVLARDAATGRIGTYETPFTVPNLEREEQLVPISSVVLGAQRVPVGGELHRVEQPVASDAVNPLVRGGARIVPGVNRVFRRSRDLRVFLEAYQRPRTAGRPLLAFATLYRGGGAVWESPPVLAEAGEQPRPWAVPLSFTIPLDDLPIGPYRLQVSVLDPGRRKVAFWRAPLAVVE